MAGNDDLFRALSMFTDGVKSFGQTRAILNANQASKEIEQSDMEDAQKQSQRDELARQLSMHLSTMDADPNKIANTFAAIRGPQAPELTTAQSAFVHPRSTDAQKAGAREYMALENQGKIETAYAKGADKRREQLDKHMEKYGANLEKSGLPRAEEAIDIIEQALGKPIEQLTDKDELPGFGRLTSIAPNQVVSDKALKLRQAVQSLANQELRTSAGQNVTLSEMGRYKTESGSAMGLPASALITGLKSTKRKIGAIRQNWDTSAPPEVVQEYRSRRMNAGGGEQRKPAQQGGTWQKFARPRK